MLLCESEILEPVWRPGFIISRQCGRYECGVTSGARRLWVEIRELVVPPLLTPKIFALPNWFVEYYKRRKIAFKDCTRGGIANDDDSHVTRESTSSQVDSSFGIAGIHTVDTELIHVSLPNNEPGDCGANPSPMLRQDSPRHEDIRPVSLPYNNLHRQNSNSSYENNVVRSDLIRQSKPVNDEQGNNAVMSPCGSIPCGTLQQANCECNHNGSQEAVILRNGEAQGSSWEFKVIASVKCQNRNLTSTDVIGTIAFEKTNEYFATGGIARKIRVYAYSSLALGLSSFDEDDEDDDNDDEDSVEYLKQRRLRKRLSNSTTDIDHVRCCVREVCTPAKLSSLQWHRERPNLIACGDYDGVVSEWDVERTCAVSERDENGGQRIWSIDYSKDFPDLISSASDDGTVHMWDRSSERSVAVLTPPTYSSICCAEFGPVSSSLIALASADSNVYLYDTRRLRTPLLTLAHHKRAASYVRFLDRRRVVSSSIDSTVKLWDMGAFTSSPSPSPPTSKYCNLPVKSYDSHYNVRNFTGLSVRGEGGLIACGSETNQAFVYDSQKCNPIMTHSFDYKVPPNPNSGSSRLAPRGSLDHLIQGNAANNLIVSAVCWRPQPDDCTLVAANSDGVLRVLSGSSSSR